MKKQGNILNTEQSRSNGAKQAKKVVYGLTIDVSSLPKDIRREIYKDLFPE